MAVQRKTQGLAAAPRVPACVNRGSELKRRKLKFCPVDIARHLVLVEMTVGARGLAAAADEIVDVVRRDVASI